MTQGRDGISLAQKLMGVSRQLSVVVAMFVIAALLLGTAGTSFAKKKGKKSSADSGLFDTVVVSNGGSSFSGSLETFTEGSRRASPPLFWIKGTQTLLGAGSAPAGVSVSSLDKHIAVSIPIVLPVSLQQGLSIEFPNTGFVMIFGPTSTQNSAPEALIGTPGANPGGGVPTEPTVPNTTGINTAQGVAFESPFDGVNTGLDILAVANTLPTVIEPIDGDFACEAFGGFTVGTISEYSRSDLLPFPEISDVVPFNNSPVVGVTAAEVPFTQNTTIGGCDTFLLGPVGLAFDASGFLFAVNEAGVASGGPGFVTVYEPGAFGDSFPVAIVGLEGTTVGAFVDPAKIAVFSVGFEDEDELIFVTDVGDNSIKIFEPFTNFNGFFFEGTEVGTIKGGTTKLRRPLGVALGIDDGALYVVNNDTNTMAMFTDFDETGGDIAPTLLKQNRGSKFNFPVDVALPAFTPTPEPTYGTPTSTFTP